MKRWSFLFAGLLLGCGPAQTTPERPSTSVVAVQPAAPPSDDEQATTATHCAFRAAAPACPSLLSSTEKSGMDGRVEAMTKAVRDSLFRDGDALVEVSRLQLLRSNTIPGERADNDAMRADRNAKRALAVNPSAQARLVMALSLARGQTPSALHTASTRALAFDTIEATLPTDTSATVATAAGHALRGYQLLALGQPDAALAAFKRATRLAPKQALAWRGQGDVARHQSDWQAAGEAYAKAKALAPTDPVLVRSIAAAQKQRRLLLPNPQEAPLRLRRTPLAAPFAKAQPCDAAAKAHQDSQALCTSLDKLLSASTSDDRFNAAMNITRAYRDMKKVCDAREPSCGPHVLNAAIESMRTFAELNKLAQSISINKLLIRDTRDRGIAQTIQEQLKLNLADQFAQIGVLDLAGDYYEDHALTTGDGEAGEQSLVLRIALGKIKDIDRMGRRLLQRARISPERRARWAVAIAEQLRAHKGQEANELWLAQYQTLIEQHSTRLPALPDVTLPACEPMLLCAHEQLIYEGSWSPASTR